MFDAIHKLIEERIKNIWIPTDSEVAYANVPFIPTAGKPFIRPVITQTNAMLIAGNYDNGYWREFGLIIVQVFTNRRTGSRDNAVLSRKVSDMFRGYTSSSLYCLAPHVETVGETKEWYQSNVIVDFYYDKCSQ